MHNPLEDNTTTTTSSKFDMKKVASENAVVIFATKGCCMCHVATRLLHGHGVNPKVVNVAENDGSRQFPVVFVGGELLGGLDQIIAAHISGELLPKLRQARALWL